MKSAIPLLRLSTFLALLFFTSQGSFAQIKTGWPTNGNTWATIKSTGKGTIKIYWAESKPFIYKNPQGQMRGIEAEIMEGFKKYLKQNERVELEIIWQEAIDFADTYDRIRDEKISGSFGVSAFSVTPERAMEVEFSPSYMSDISVMISSKHIPVVQSIAEFNHIFSKLTAVTIKETTYEQDLLKLKTDLPFKIKYIPSKQNILRTIEEMDSAFGFIDLPVYMMIFNNDPSVNVKRQNLFPVKRKGYAIIFPLGSDWTTPMNEYFYSEVFKQQLETIIAKYIDIELYRFVESLAIQSNDPIILLTKEKEIQQRDLLGKSEQIIQETKRRNFLIALVTIVFAFLIIIILLYKKRNEQKVQIEAQGKSLAKKSEELEKRNQHLVALDQEKNNLIKILAHDLRTPINHVQGLAHVLLLGNETLPEDQKMIIRNISDASVRLNKMITNILDVDAIENNRVKIFMDGVAITQLVRQVVKSFEKPALRKNITLSFTSTNEECLIKGDSLFLIQVFENLLSNAIKFSESDKAVETSVVEANNKVVVRVRDHGQGLTDDDMASIFKKFTRLSAKPTGGESSMGLGLSIVKKYVELMGGRVYCESPSGDGATFIVEFDSLKS